MTLLGSLFSAKLASDDRVPALHFEVPSVGLVGDYGGTIKFGILAPSILFWIQLTAIMLIQAAFAAAASALTYRFVVRRRGTPLSYLVGFGAIVPACALNPYVVVAALGLRNKILKFVSCAILPNLTLFRTLEAMAGTSPPGVEDTLGSYILYSASAMEAEADPKTGGPAPATARDALRNMGAFGAHVLILGAYKSAFGPSYELFAGRAPPTAGLPRRWWSDLADPARLGNNFVAALLLQLYLTTFCYGLIALTNIVVGIRTKYVMVNPLFKSTSPSDFWGRRWNMLVHGILKRGVFKPVRRHFSVPTAVAAAFLASGLMHEWILHLVFFEPIPRECADAPSCHRPTHGMNLAFFLWNAVVVSLEYAFGDTPVFRWAGKALPRPVVTALVLGVALPVAHWFTADFLASDYFEHGQIGFPVVVRVPS